MVIIPVINLLVSLYFKKEKIVLQGSNVCIRLSVSCLGSGIIVAKAGDLGTRL